MAVPDSMRTSDAERDEVLDRLRDALVQGRLTTDEFNERTTATLVARTHGQLRGVTADLPAAPSRPLVALGSPAVPKSAAAVSARWLSVLRSLSWGWFPIFAACSLVWFIGGRGSFWPAWLLVWAVFSFRGQHRLRRRQRAASQHRYQHEQRQDSDRLGR